MTFVTKLTLQSGDRHLLDDVVGEITDLVERKGAEMKGPHPEPPDSYRVARYKRLEGEGGRFDPWTYTVYTRTIEIIGHDPVARLVTERPYPPAIHLQVDVSQIRPMGNR